MQNDNTPVLIGVGQVTERQPDLEKVSSPIDLMEAAVYAALDDAGLGRSALADLDELVVVRSFREPARNSPESLARRLGAGKARQWMMPNGGNGPQYLVNRYAQRIAEGKNRFVLFSGSEAMDSGRRMVKSGIKPPWVEDASRDPDYLYPEQDMANAHEAAHGFWIASHVYPLFENALRGHYGHTIEEHQRSLGELFAPFSAAAARSPHAWFPIERSAEEIATATPANRYVGWPYTKFMNAMNQINQSAAILMTSVKAAKEMGVNPSRWVYLHGCADATEIWNISERANYHSSPAIRVMTQRAFAMAGKSASDLDHLDLYSCFPSAVQIARDELGIARDDPRDLTITGGLPFHGGAGNNYVMNSIAAMADKVRETRGSYGMVTANGGYLTKHAVGIYSTQPTKGPWRREAPEDYQGEIDNTPRPAFTQTPEGQGIIETYTVTFGRGNTPERGIIIGRLGDGSDPMAPRFIANTPHDTDLLSAMTREDFLGRAGSVVREGDINIFRPNH
jgi:acetyl-CoA C-acetyltransferase